MTSKDFTMLTANDKIYVAGAPNPADLPGTSSYTNFIGCLKAVSYTVEQQNGRANSNQNSRQNSQTIGIHLSQLKPPAVMNTGYISTGCHASVGPSEISMYDSYTVVLQKIREHGRRLHENIYLGSKVTFNDPE